MRRAILVLTLVGGLAGAVVPDARAEVTAEQVRVAIDRGVNFLKGRQRKDGSWPDFGGYRGGVTALCTLALLNAGVEPDEDGIRRALNNLRNIPPEKTYVVALQTMVFCKAVPERDRALVARNVKWLQKTQIIDGPTRGSWTYPHGPTGRSGDNSNTQFAVLALHEAERIGVEVDGRTWRQAEAYWKRTQNPNGSWGYMTTSGTGSQPECGSMTCAGIASLVITADKIHSTNAQADGDRIRCCLDEESDDDCVRRGLQWLGSDRVFAVSHNPGRPQAHWLYYLYALERVGRLTAQRFIGKHDWYREGADRLLKAKGGATTDHWVGIGQLAEGRDKNVATAFALLFLSKGRRPILLAKLKHGNGNDWNRHRSDVANLTRYVESKWKQDLTWQVADLRAASVEDLLESPVLYLCGRESPLPKSKKSQQQLADKLRAYLDRGGFLFAEAYGAGSEFDRGFRELVKLAFPEPEYALTPFPPGHPIWRTEEAVPAKYVRTLWGVESGCRTSLVYCPPDESGRVRPSLSCLWELDRSGRDRQFSPEVNARVNAGLSIGINVLAWATNRELKFKDPAKPETARSQSSNPFPRGQISVANLRHYGGCNAAPRALITLLETAARERNIRTVAEERDLSITDEALFDYHLVFMHGRNAFTLTDAERERLRAYVERGGMVFANSICASRRFSDAFRREMQAIFPDHSLEPIPADHPLFKIDYGGYDLSTVTRRDPQARSRNEPLKDLLREVSPELEGIRIGDRYGVIFSRYDLSCALEKRDSMECQGYVRQDAARIGMNVLLYSLQH
jgi:hypothetical protein